MPTFSIVGELSADTIFQNSKHDWLAAHKEEFVLIGLGQTVGFYLTYEQALRAGLRRFGLKTSFLIKQVLDPEPVMVIY